MENENLSNPKWKYGSGELSRIETEIDQFWILEKMLLGPTSDPLLAFDWLV